MIDLKYLQKNFEEAAQRLKSKGVDEVILEELKDSFEELKKAKELFEAKRSKQNQLSKLFGVYKKEGKDISELKAEVDNLKIEVAKLQQKQREAEERLNKLALQIPNFPDFDVPVGKDEEDNIELKRVLEPKEFDFEPKEHWELGAQNGWIDFERGVKLAKSRFALFKGQGARLQRALINFFLDRLEKEGFQEYGVPYMVNSKMLIGTGQLPKFEDDLFRVCQEDLYLIPTAEVPLTNIFYDEIVDSNSLPFLMSAHSPCFRKEAGSAGRDTRGIIRQHQFEKVEMVAITKPEESDEIFEKMVQIASNLLTELKLPHRVVMLCSGDLGFSAAKTIDLEVWLPGQKRYREISSISNTRDFQARRAKIRFKDGKKSQFVHTLNGSALAVGRTLVAIMENYQQKDGSIQIPEVLKEFI
jgi:seryl-tRNA synthetase